MSNEQQQHKQQKVEQQKDANADKKSSNLNAEVEQSNAFNQMFATLEAEHQKLMQLEQRRLKLTEEMKNLRDKLQLENCKMQSKINESQTETETETKSNDVKITEIDWDAMVREDTGLLEQAELQRVEDMTLKTVDSSVAVEQYVCTIEAPAIWHMPVCAIDLESDPQQTDSEFESCDDDADTAPN